VERFGTDRYLTIHDFALEVHRGESRLMVDATKHHKLVRVVDVVLLRIQHAAKRHDTEFLLETKTTYWDGRERDSYLRLPGCKMKPEENTRTAAERLIFERLNMTDCMVELNLEDEDTFEEDEESPSYPGVRTVYRKHIIEGTVMTTDNEKLHRIGIPVATGNGMTSRSGWHHSDFRRCTRHFAWMTEKECAAKHVTIRPPHQEGNYYSALVDAHLGMNERQLRQFLKEHDIDPNQYGQFGSKTLQEFSNELIRGDSTIVIQTDNEDGHSQLVRIVDTVHLLIRNTETGQALIEVEEIAPSGRVTTLHCLPDSRRRPDENQFSAAQQCLRQLVKIRPTEVRIDAAGVRVVEDEEDDKMYPGLKTVQRKRVIPGDVHTNISAAMTAGIPCSKMIMRSETNLTTT